MSALPARHTPEGRRARGIPAGERTHRFVAHIGNRRVIAFVPGVLPMIARERNHRSEIMSRRAIMSAARVQECNRRRIVASALSALETLLPTADAPKPRTMADALEMRYAALAHERMTVQWLMRLIPHDGRPPMAVKVAQTVNAQTVRASAAPRVRDSHDARPASERRSARPYSGRTMARDVAVNYRPRVTHECVSLFVPPITPGTPYDLAAECNAARDRGVPETIMQPRTGKREGNRRNRPVVAGKGHSEAYSERLKRFGATGVGEM